MAPPLLGHSSHFGVMFKEHVRQNLNKMLTIVYRPRLHMIFGEKGNVKDCFILPTTNLCRIGQFDVVTVTVAVAKGKCKSGCCPTCVDQKTQPMLMQLKTTAETHHVIHQFCPQKRENRLMTPPANMFPKCPYQRYVAQLISSR